MEPEEEFLTFLSPELRKLYEDKNLDPDSYDKWEALVLAAESQEQGLSRNSSPQAIAAYRGIYDRFLAKFPLFFGYWKKYADLEFAIAGTEAAELVYERGTAGIPHSVDIWKDYCTFKTETTHDPDPIRELFERGAEHIGIDFMSHPFWDKYMDFEERLEDHDRVFAILLRVIYIPLHQYAKYFERFRQFSQSRPVKDLLPAEKYAQFKSEHEMNMGANYDSANLDRDLRPRVQAYHDEVYQKTQAETNKRWAFEQHIKRPYFHVTEVDDDQLQLWKRYLEFEEMEGDRERITFLYERCVIALAYYESYWLRYARWMQGQINKTEEVRHIYMRASCLYAPIARPEIRLHWALFEEREGRFSVAYAIYAAIVEAVPGMVEAITYWASAARRQSGIDAAVEIYRSNLSLQTIDHATKATLVTEWARLLWQVKRAPDEARQLFQQYEGQFLDQKVFFDACFDLEFDEMNEESVEGGRRVMEAVRKRAQLSKEQVRELAEKYSRVLLQRGGKEAAREFLVLDRECAV